jgi:hypothetical protein
MRITYSSVLNPTEPGPTTVLSYLHNWLSMGPKIMSNMVHKPLAPLYGPMPQPSIDLICQNSIFQLL